MAYNFEYYVYKHVPCLVKPGARLINIPDRNDVLAFRNPDCKTIFVCTNFA